MKLRDEKGSTVVESAIIFTVFLLMLFGITDFGLALYRQEVLKEQPTLQIQGLGGTKKASPQPVLHKPTL